MENNWKSLWKYRLVNQKILQSGNMRNIFLELKKCNGFDVVGDGLTYEALLDQYVQIKTNISSNEEEINSIYEVGCGSGANLYLFEKDGMQCGGVDYSEGQIAVARQVLHTEDLLCEEAINTPVEPMYDGVLSNSVFSYFVNEEYALEVLEKMYKKARYSIAIIDIHDKEKKSEYITFRKKVVEDYEKRYKDLPKLFYSKEFFTEFAEKHDLDIIFKKSDVKEYWNNHFIFNCYMYKRKKG